MIAAGKMIERITIRRLSEADDGAGEPVVTWSDLATVWAEPMDVAANESREAGVVADAPSIAFRIRNNGDAAGVTSDDRIVWVTNGDAVLIVTGVERRSARDPEMTIRAKYLEPGEA